MAFVSVSAQHAMAGNNPLAATQQRMSQQRVPQPPNPVQWQQQQEQMRAAAESEASGSVSASQGQGGR